MDIYHKRYEDGQILRWSFIIVISLALLSIIIFPLKEGNYFSIISGCFLILLASLVLGLLMGFIFGVPKSKQKKAMDNYTSTPIPNKGNNNENTSSPYEPNTNLEDISDWLTKIIVGVGLTQMASIDPSISRLSSFLSVSIGIMNPSSGFVYTLLLYGIISGFIFGYVLTRIYLPYLFKFSDMLTVSRLKEEVVKLNKKVNENDLIGNMRSSLYQYEDQGYENAIKIAKEFLNDGNEPTDVHFWIYLACAYSQKFTNNENDSNVRIEALNATNEAINFKKDDNYALTLLRYLWDPVLHEDSEENDLEIFYNDIDFKKLLGKQEVMAIN